MWKESCWLFDGAAWLSSAGVVVARSVRVFPAHGQTPVWLDDY
ncbi:MAG: hypothetical protein FD153_1113 [Rhodospirillaceae bacterium]|nr:MAG: hypothetical protein FD153_1113 [Rhodospirillaceae bacterium]